MAKVNQGILGGYIGKVGTVVGYIMRGKAFLRARTEHTHNPRSSEQQVVRARFAVLADLQSSFLAAIRIGLEVRAKQHRNSAPNNFVQLNWEAVSAISADAVTVDYAKLVVSAGKMTGVQFGRPSFDDSLSVAVNYTANGGAQGIDTADEVFLFVYAPDENNGVLGVAKRSDSSMTVQVPAEWAGQTVHIYGFVRGAGEANAGKLSQSVYVGTGTIA